MRAKVDELNLMILRSVLQDGHNYPARAEAKESMSEIARKLDVSEPTIRTRLNGLIDSGFLGGWAPLLNPCLIGQKLAHILTEVNPATSKQDVIRKVKLIDGVSFLANYHGNNLSIALYYDRLVNLERRIDLITAIASSERVTYSEILFPTSHHRFNSSDLAIIRAMQFDAWPNNRSIARRTALSLKTVKRRLGHMTHDVALFFAPILNFSCLRGSIGMDFAVFYRKSERERATEQTILGLVDRWLVIAVRGRESTFITMLLNNISELNIIIERIRAMPNVREAYSDLIDNYALLPEHFTDQLQLVSNA